MVSGLSGHAIMLMAWFSMISGLRKKVLRIVKLDSFGHARGMPWGKCNQILPKFSLTIVFKKSPL
jgi:hypothetical protein